MAITICCDGQYVSPHSDGAGLWPRAVDVELETCLPVLPVIEAALGRDDPMVIVVWAACNSGVGCL